MPFEDGKIQFPAQPDGNQSDLGGSLRDVLNEQSGKRLAAVLLLGDGAQRVLTPRANIQQAARQLARRGTPLYTIPFGLARDQSEARDVAVENFQDQYSVFVNNRLTLQAAVRIQGFVGNEVPVRIDVTGPDGSQSQLGPVPAVAQEDGQQVQVRFQFEPPKAGQYKLELVAEPQSGELILENNRLIAFVNAIEGGLRVLQLYSSRLDPEQQQLRRSLASSPDIQLDGVFVDLRRRSLWPVQLPQDVSYDVMILSDVPADALGDQNLQTLRQQVDDGLGLIMTGGPQSFGPGGYAATPLAPVLPVEMKQLEKQAIGLDVQLPPDLHAAGPITMQPDRHFLVQLAETPAENAQIWRRLPALLGANRLQSKPNARVLLAGVADGPRLPLLVAGNFGGGRVLAMAADTTHLWYRHGHGTAHKQFWRQVMLWLAHRDQSRRSDVWIRLERRRYLPGSEVTFAAGVRDESGQTISAATLTAQVTTPEGPPIDVPTHSGRGPAHGWLLRHHRCGRLRTDRPGAPAGPGDWPCVGKIRCLPTGLGTGRPGGQPRNSCGPYPRSPKRRTADRCRRSSCPSC